MTHCLILNPGAGTADTMETLRAALDAAGVVVRETTAEGQAADVAEAAAREGFDVVAAAGGDGTINEVVGGLMRLPQAERPAFGVIPMGTGNDLARTLALSTEPEEALALLLRGRTTPLDVFRLDAEGRVRYGVNVAAGGFSGAVNEAMTAELKKSWGPLAYLIGAVKALPEITPFRVTIQMDDAPVQSLDLFNVFVSNGRFVAGGKLVAPLASVEDGLLDVVIVRVMSGADMALMTARFVTGTHLESPHVETIRARRVVLESDPGMLFNVDGELVTHEPVTFTVEPAALRVVSGDDYEAGGGPLLGAMGASNLASAAEPGV